VCRHNNTVRLNNAILSSRTYDWLFLLQYSLRILYIAQTRSAFGVPDPQLLAADVNMELLDISTKYAACIYWRYLGCVLDGLRSAVTAVYNAVITRYRLTLPAMPLYFVPLPSVCVHYRFMVEPFAATPPAALRDAY